MCEMLWGQVYLYHLPGNDDRSAETPCFFVFHIPDISQSSNPQSSHISEPGQGLHRSYSYMTCSSKEPRFTQRRSMHLPKIVASCGPALIACTSFAAMLDPESVLLHLFLQGYSAAKWSYSGVDLPGFVHSPWIKNIRECFPFPEEAKPTHETRPDFSIVCETPTIPSSHVPDFRTSSVRGSFGHRTRPESINSIASFATASSHATFFTAKSARSNSARMSTASGYNTSRTSINIRQDELPGPELPTHLAQLQKDYYTTLRHQEIIQPFDKELNWSGKGQHVTFAAGETIPLLFLSHLGQSHTALVEKVLCRRIALARKTMRCNGRWTVADALSEVYHLQNLRHFHIVQLVGTYLQGRNFSILMYPVADSHLGTFLEDTVDMPSSEPRAIKARQWFLASTLACLTSALAFVHKNTTKHMDIKPQNILIRNTGQRAIWRAYLADFGLSRSFASQDHSQTDGPTSRTPRYCSPEVYNDEPRGRPADIFSLGCVFLEISCVIAGMDPQDFASARRGDGNDESFHANLERVIDWARTSLQTTSSVLVWSESDPLHLKALVELVLSMINRVPSERPTATKIHERLFSLPGDVIPFTTCCSFPPEPYERYESPE